MHRHARPGHEGEEGAEHNGRLELQLRTHEDGTGAKVGVDRLLHQVLHPVALVGLGGGGPDRHEIGHGVGHDARRLGVMVLELL